MMSADRERLSSLREALIGLLIETSNIEDPSSQEDFLEFVAGAATLRTEADELLHTAVTSARAAGATWQRIGETLGMSRQAAQKRFAWQADPAPTELDPEERTISPVTAFDELHELGLAGRYGWHSVEFGPFYHRVVRSETQWEHRRVTMSAGRARRLVAEGWQKIGSEFPFTYLKRDTGILALEEPSD